MGNYKFGVQCLNQPKRSLEDVDFILTERVWDDFGFRTFYDITATSKLLMSIWIVALVQYELLQPI